MRDLFKALSKDEAHKSSVTMYAATNGSNQPASAQLNAKTIKITPYEAKDAPYAAATNSASPAEKESLIASSLSQFLTYHEKLVVKGTTLVIGILGILIALFPPDIVVWVNLFAFGGLESSFLWVIILGLFSRRYNKTGAIASVVGGVGTYCFMMITKLSILSFHAIVPALVVGLICGIIGSYIGRKLMRDTIDHATHDVFFPHKPYLDDDKTQTNHTSLSPSLAGS